MNISYAIFLKQKDYRQDGPTVGGVLSELHILRDGQWELLARNSDGSGQIRDVIPGQYKFKVLRWMKTTGEIEELGDDNEQIFRLNSGESSNLRVVLEKTPTGLIIVLSITVVVLVVALIYLIAHNDADFDIPGLTELPVPPLPDPGIFYWLPQPDLMLTNFMIPNEFEPADGFSGDGTDGRESREKTFEIIDYYPLANQSDVSIHDLLWIEFSRKIDSGSLDHRNFVVEDSSGTLVPGGLYVDQELSRAVFHPLRPLSVGQPYQITLYGHGLRWQDGSHLHHNYRWTFQPAVTEK